MPSVSSIQLPAPHRVLTLSADMGGGHNATAAALEELAGTLWPGTEIQRLDTLDVLGPGVGRLFRAIYVSNVEDTPWLYEFFYSSLWRHRWFAHASKRFIGSWCGRRLAGRIDRFDPDMILSTYPLGSAGLAWLRRHRGLAVPTAAYVSDFSPHPFWIYRDLDVNFVAHEMAVPQALAAEPGATVGVCAPPVVRRFAPGDAAAARSAFGLPGGKFIALVSCGSYSFGDTVATVRALLDAGPGICVVVACGRNEHTRRELSALGQDERTLRPVGWTDQMPTLITAADVVVGNAGGAIALEALACGRPVLLVDPIAAHGRANADLMVVSGLAELVTDPNRLTEHVRGLIEDPAALRDAQQRAMDHLGRHDLAQGVRGVGSAGASAPPVPGDWPMRAGDAFFTHVDATGVRQELGVVLELGPGPEGRPVDIETLRSTFGARFAGLPTLRRAAVRRPHAAWRLLAATDPAEHVSQRSAPDVPGGIDGAVEAFWGEPLPSTGPPWQAVLFDERSQRRVLAIKLHHSLGDGVSMLGLLDRVLDPLPEDRLIERGRPGSSPSQARPFTATLTVRARQTGRAVTETLGGLVSLAARGLAPAHPLNSREVGPGRLFAGVALPAIKVKQLARLYRAHPPEVLLAVIAGALGTLLGDAGLCTPDTPLRVMFPVSRRALRLDHIFGNWTGSVALDLPISPQPFGQRVSNVRSELRRRIRRGEPRAASAVMTIAGALPEPVHREFARVVYGRHFFNSIVSYMPGARGPRTCAGVPVTAAYPVLPLAAGVPLTVGVIVADAVAGVGILADSSLGLTREAIVRAVHDSFSSAGVKDP